MRDRPGKGRGGGAAEARRKKWNYINVLKDAYPEFQEILDVEGKRLGINDIPELIRTILTMVLLEWKKSHSFAEATENTFIEMFPTVRHYDELRGVLTKTFQEYVKRLEEEQQRRSGKGR